MKDGPTVLNASYLWKGYGIRVNVTLQCFLCLPPPKKENKKGRKEASLTNSPAGVEQKQ